MYIKTEQHRQRLREANLGKKHSDESKRKMSLIRLGKKFTEEHKRKIGLAHLGKPRPLSMISNMMGPKHAGWVHGTPKNKYTLHMRMRMLYGDARFCENKACDRKSNRFDWSNKLHDYKTTNPEDWQQLCRSCHKKYDSLLRKSKKENGHAKH